MKRTVAELRALCKAAGLPCYQSAGKRLKKADLERQLAAASQPRRVRRAKKAKPVTAADLARFAAYEIDEMARGLDRLFDPAASRRAATAFLVASEKPLTELVARRRPAERIVCRDASGQGTASGRVWGVRTV